MELTRKQEEGLRIAVQRHRNIQLLLDTLV